MLRFGISPISNEAVGIGMLCSCAKYSFCKIDFAEFNNLKNSKDFKTENSTIFLRILSDLFGPKAKEISFDIHYPLIKHTSVISGRREFISEGS